MSNQKLKFYVGSCMAAVAALVITLISMDDNPPSAVAVGDPVKAPLKVNDDKSPGPVSANIARGLPPTETPKVADTETGPLLDLLSVQNMLEEIPRNPEGELVYNGDTRKLLDHACSEIGRGRTKSEIEGLLQLVRASLPQNDASAVTDTLTRYCQLKFAEQDRADGASADSPATQYRELKDLRESYLGHTLAGQLFAEEDRFFQFHLKLMELNKRNDLTDQERARLQEQLEHSYRLPAP